MLEEVAKGLQEAVKLKKILFSEEDYEIELESLGERPPLEYLTGAKIVNQPTPKMEDYEDMFADMGDEEILPQCDLENPDYCESCQ